MTQSEARRLRSDEGLSVAQIQRRLGFSKHRLTEWLRGTQPPDWTVRPNAKRDLRARATVLRGEGWYLADGYHGCVVVTVARSRDSYWRVEAVMAALAKQIGSCRFTTGVDRR